MRLLLIEKDSTNGKVLKDVFSLWGYDVGLCLSAEELTAHLEETDWNGVVTELAIPGLGKYQAISRVKEEMPWVPVIVLTENGSVKSAVRAIKSGADEFFIKPADVNQLQSVLDQISENISEWQKTGYPGLNSKNAPPQFQRQLQKIFRLQETSQKDYQRLKMIQQSLLDTISDGILVIDDKGTVFLLNEKMAGFLGIPDAVSVYKKNLFKEFPGLKSSQLFHLFWETLRNKRSVKIRQFALANDSLLSSEFVEMEVAVINFHLKDSIFNGVIFIMKKGNSHEC